MNVVVYSQPGCTRCTATMRMMTKLGVPFDVVDIRQDHAAADRLRAMGYLETPVVEVGDVSWSGFRPDAIKELAGTAAGGLLHILIDPLSAGPLVGASAGISALMAAAARFVFQPPVSGYGAPAWQVPPPRPAETIPELLRNRTAVSFLVIWLLTNLLFGLVSVPLVGENAAIAWDAHLGGFIAGFFLFPLVDPREPRRH